MLKQILWTACITPFTADGKSIDYQSLERCLRIQEEAGNGIILFGSTGESLSISEQEKKDILHFVDKLELENQIIVGVPSYNLLAAQEWIRFCNDLPLHGYLITTPIYAKPGIAGQTEWFQILLNEAKYPAILYNIPGRAGIKLHPATVKNLENHDKFIAIKDSSGTVESIAEYQIATNKIAIYCGDDYMMPSFAAEGAIGLISVASNVWPKATRKYVQLCLAKQELKSKIWWQACKALFTASNPIPIKALMKDVGLISNNTLRLPLTQNDFHDQATLLNYHQLIINWNSENEL